METYKQTPYLIERLKTSEIDNLLEVSEEYPDLFNAIYNDLKYNRYWNEVKFDTVMCMCNSFTLNGDAVSLYQFQNFFKND